LDVGSKSSDLSLENLAIIKTAKDEKYWTRRKKNNLSAKKSRDARRIKENQCVIAASILQAENEKLQKKLEEVQHENENLKQRLNEYISCYDKSNKL